MTRLVILLSLGISAGCTAGPDYAPPVAPLSESWSALYPHSITVDDAVDEVWWHAFQDPLLSNLVDRVRSQNFSLAEASARIAESRARLGMARGSLWPVAYQTDNYTRRQFSENGTPFGPLGLPTAPFNLWSLGFDAAWELDVAGKLRRTIEAAEADFERSLEDHNGMLVSLIGEVARTYVELRTAQERVAVARENARLQQETLRLTQERLRWGAVSPLDVSQAQTQLAQTEAAIPELVNQAKLAENRLCLLQGEPPHSLEAALSGQGIPRPPQQIAVGLPLELLRRRPDVRQAERSVAAASAQIGIAAAELYPQFSLTGTFTLDANSLSRALVAESLFYSTGPAVRWNILNFGRVRGNIEVQEARFQQAVAHYRETVLTAASEVDSAISTFARRQEQQERLAAAVASARESVRVARDRYLEGAVGFQSLLDAQRVLIQVQDQQVAASGSVAAAAVALYKALGGGWESFEDGAIVIEPEVDSPVELLPPVEGVPMAPRQADRQ